MHVRTGERGFETMSMEYQVQEKLSDDFSSKRGGSSQCRGSEKECRCDHRKRAYQICHFDFEQTDFMDSSGIGVIMGRYRMICLIGGEVWAVHANARIRKILTMSGVTKIMQIYEEEQV